CRRPLRSAGRSSEAAPRSSLRQFALPRRAYVVAIDAKRERAQANHEDPERDECQRPADRVGEVLPRETAGIGQNPQRGRYQQRPAVHDDAQIDEAGRGAEEEELTWRSLDDVEQAREKGEGGGQETTRRQGG